MPVKSAVNGQKLSNRSSPSLSVSSSSPRVITHYLLEKNAPKSDIEAALSHPIGSLEDAEFRLPIEQYLDLWTYALAFSGEADLGLTLGARLNEDEVGLVSHFFFSNGTIREAINQYQRYFSITNEEMTLEVIEDQDIVRLVYQHHHPEHYCIPDIERTLAAGVCRTRHQLQVPTELEYVSFVHPRPDYELSYENVFQCPLKFKATQTEIAFKAAYLDHRLPHKSSYLQKVLSTHLENLLNRAKGKHQLTDKVKALVIKRLSSDSIDADHIAKKLNMSRNTLHRKLSAEQTSFHDLVEDVRKEKAIKYLKTRKYSLSQIAFLLGFSELSAFSRAFKRWTGSAPGKYLDQDAD